MDEEECLMKSLAVSRRRMLALVGASAVAVPALANAKPFRPHDEEPSASPDVAEEEGVGDASDLLAPLTTGSMLGAWHVTGLSEVRHGALTVRLSDAAGATFYLDVCARDVGLGAHAPPARSECYDIYLSNHGKGADPTVEDHGLAAMALSEILRANENRVRLDGFLTLRERLARFPDEVVRGV